jgi:hypothetical protein
LNSLLRFILFDIERGIRTHPKKKRLGEYADASNELNTAEIHRNSTWKGEIDTTARKTAETIGICPYTPSNGSNELNTHEIHRNSTLKGEIDMGTPEDLIEYADGSKRGSKGQRPLVGG